MTNRIRTINELDAAAALAGSDFFEVEQGTGSSFRATLNNVVTFVQGAVAGVTVSPGGGSFATQLQEANDYVRNDLGGGYISLKPGALYTLNGNVLFDVGTGVGLNGNGAIIDAQGVSSGYAFTFTSRPRSSGFQVPGFDGNSRNFFQKRVEFGGFGAVGPAEGGSVGLFDINSQSSGSRSPRVTIKNVVGENFGIGVRLANRAYLCKIADSIFTDCGTCVLYSGGSDQGENNVFDHVAFANSPVGLVIDSGSGQACATFENCSFDYNGKHVQLTGAGYAIFHFNSCHFEHSTSSAEYPIDLPAVNNRSLFLFKSPRILGGDTRNWPAYFRVGNHVKVVVTDPHIHNMDGAGVIIGVGKGSGGADVAIAPLANVSGSGNFKIRGTREFITTSLPRVAALDAPNQWLADFDMEDAAVVDNWYDAGGSPGTNIGVIAKSAAEVFTGTNSLAVPLINGSGNIRTLRCVVPIPRDGSKFSWRGYTKLSAGSGTGYVTVEAVKIRDYPFYLSRSGATINGAATLTGLSSTTDLDPGVQLRGPGIPANTYVLSVDSASQITMTKNATASATVAVRFGRAPVVKILSTYQNDVAFTPLNTHWTSVGLTNSEPRYEIPEGATHVRFTFTLSDINNAGGNMFFDNFYVTGW